MKTLWRLGDVAISATFNVIEAGLTILEAIYFGRGPDAR
jgi:hypothetical protein